MVGRKCQRNLSICVHACACIMHLCACVMHACACVMHACATSVHVCAYSLHMYMFVFINSYGCMPQHANAYRTLCTHAWDMYSFSHFSCPIMILMLFFISFCRFYPPSQVEVVPVTSLLSIGP